MNKAVDPALLHAAESTGASPGLKMDAYWMPFTANRQFKKAPRLLARAAGMHYWDDHGRQILDGVAGLWCVNAGHARPRIVQAIQQQAAELDFAPPFQMAHPKAFELAERVAQIAPAGMSKVFFTNSGSEAVETALKMALAYHRVRGEGTRTRLIGRERGYHGVNFGGISVGGMVGNRKMFGTLLGGVDHIRHTHDLARNAFSVGQPEHGAELADDLERLVALHDASTIAAVIVEPIAIFSAVSTASEPELVKNTLFKPAGVNWTRRSASSNAFGWAMLNGGAKSISAACAAIASTIFGRAWPAFTHHRPAMPSRIWRPSGVQ